VGLSARWLSAGPFRALEVDRRVAPRLPAASVAGFPAAATDKLAARLREGRKAADDKQEARPKQAPASFVTEASGFRGSENAGRLRAERCLAGRQAARRELTKGTAELSEAQRQDGPEA
jgi:hypothetical protein